MQEKISAIKDNDFAEADLLALLAEMDSDPDLKQDWDTCHLISDLLQGEPVMSGDFMSRFSARLEAEPVVLAPGRLTVGRQGVGRYWKGAAVAASVMLVSAAAMLTYNRVEPQPMMAQGVIASQQPQVNPYLAAHQELSGNPGGQHIVLTSADVSAGVVAK